MSRTTPTNDTTRKPPRRGNKLGKIVLRSADALRLAEAFRDNRFTNESGHYLLRSWRGDWYEWQFALGYYVLMNPADLRDSIWSFLDGVIIKSEEKTSLRVTSHVVREVEHALRSRGLAVQSLTANVWLTKSSIASSEILVAPNGLFHYPTSVLYGATPLFFATSGLGAEVLIDANEPEQWHRFLSTLWPDDPDSIETLQEFFGYVLCADTSLQKILLMIGPPRSGKGTILRILTALLGAGSTAGPTLSSLGERFGLWPLLGKKLAVISDARLSGRQDQAMILERLLSISGEDVHTIDRKNREPLTTALGTRLVIATNELPALADSSGAYASRFVLLILRASFLGKEDRKLGDRLLEELVGILAWAIEGLKRLNSRGYFTQPESARELLTDLARLASPTGAFVADRCEVGPHLQISVDELFAEWLSWCASEGRSSAGTKQSFGKALQASVPDLKRSQLRVPGESKRRVRMYTGIGLGKP